MEIITVEEKENPFFKRKDVKLSIKHLGSPTPSKSELVKELATKYNVDKSQTQINYILSKRGLGESFVSVKILEEKPKEVPKEAKLEEKTVEKEKIEEQPKAVAETKSEEESKGETDETQASQTA